MASERSYFSYPRFFKIIQDPPDHVLKLPYAFMRKYGSDLQDTVYLKVPNGNSWKVELVHNENHGALLQKGWEKFSEYYSIKEFYFLEFKYEGNSQFIVSIFSQSAVEIEYPVVHTYREWNGNRRTVTEISSDDEGSILEENDLKTPDLKRKKSLEDDDVSIEILDSSSAFNPKSGSCPTQRENKNYRDNGKSAIDKEKIKSYEEAKAFTSPYPFFIRFMQPTYVSGKCALELPAKFWKAYMMGHQKRHLLKLVIISGKQTKTWSVIAVTREHPYPRGRITTGWKKFVIDNGLQVGNTCVFELIPSDTQKFKVTIF